MERWEGEAAYVVVFERAKGCAVKSQGLFFALL